MKRSHLITIDVDAHPKDREVRATLLHEMAHAATGNAGVDMASNFSLNWNGC
jgi:hypothetical protein